MRKRIDWGLWLSVVANLATVSGVSSLTIAGYLIDPAAKPFAFLNHPYRWLVVLLGTALLATVGTAIYFQRRIEQLEPKQISKTRRAAYSQGFVSTALRRVDILGGDLSWFEEDIGAYRDLRRRGVEVRVLTDSPTSPAIEAGKVYGIAFRAYPGGVAAPLKATVCDADEEAESKMLLVKRTAAAAGASDYGYWMREYFGRDDPLAIRAVGLLFEDLFARGAAL